MFEGITLSQYIIESQKPFPNATGNFTLLLNDIAVTCKSISAAVKKGQLANVLGNAGTGNIQGEDQKVLDVIANDLFIKNNIRSGHVTGLVSEEMDDILHTPDDVQRGKYILLYDPLDGSSNIDINGPIGTIFSIFRSPLERPKVKDFLQNGRSQLCAGYCLYGPATMIVLSVGKGVQGFTLNPELGEFILTHPNIKIPKSASEYSINHANRHLWEAPMRAYVEACELGKTGPRQKKYTMRWVGAMVMDVHRILMRGGMFAYPMDSSLTTKGGRLRLMYEANPLSFLVEQAGGIASTGYQNILDLMPKELHQRVPVILGSQEEMDVILALHRQYAKENNLPFYH